MAGGLGLAGVDPLQGMVQIGAVRGPGKAKSIEHGSEADRHEGRTATSAENASTSQKKLRG